MMTAQQLKNSILQRAIEGKLVEQRAEEGTAKELLKEIRLEKEKLSQKGIFKSRKKVKLLDICQDDYDFEIPDNWQWVRLGEIADVFGRIGFRGYTKADLVEKGNGAITISPSNMTKAGTMDFSSCSYISWEKYDESPEIMVSEDDILVVKTGSSYGKTSLIDTLPEKATINPQIAILKYVFCEKKYLVFFLNSIEAQNQFKSFVIGTSIPTFSQEKLLNMKVPLPPLSEQHRIVAKIEELMPLVDQYDKAYSQLTDLNEKFPQDMKKSILQYAIEGKLVEQRPEEGTAKELLKEIKLEKEKLVKEGKIKKSKALASITEDEIPFDIPENWEWVRLGDIGLTNIGLTYKPTDIIHENGTAVLRSNNIQDGKIVYDDMVYVKTTVPSNKMCNTGDILICARNGSKRLVGKAAVIEHEGMSFGTFMAIFKPLSLDSYYVLSVINSAYFRNTLLNDTGTTTINQITQTMLKDFLIPLPPLSEQHRIVAKIEELMPLCDKLVKTK